MLYPNEQPQGKRNPVIVIPGILGSRLVETESSQSVWGEFGRSLTTRAQRNSARLIALPMQEGVALQQLTGQSRSDGTLRHVTGNIAGIPVRVTTYANVLEAMGVGTGEQGAHSRRLAGYHDHAAHEVTAFEFDYDWRRSIDENARRLEHFMVQAMRFIQLQGGTSDPVRFDLVAHSMGGLIARYYLQYGGQLAPMDGTLPKLNWAGAANVDTVIIIGTPNAGSLFALERLVSGMPRNRIAPGYDPVVLGTMPSVYQLLPRPRHGTFGRRETATANADFTHPAFWQEMRWGLAAPGLEKKLEVLLPGLDSPTRRSQTALEHLDKCLHATRVVHRALDAVDRRPDGLYMHLIAGDARPTYLRCSARRGDTALTTDQKGAGDGTVSRASALLDERVGGRWVPRIVSPLKWDSIMYLSSNHLGLTRDPVAIRNILHLLYENPHERG